jgi:hypothetical protein
MISMKYKKKERKKSLLVWNVKKNILVVKEKTLVVSSIIVNVKNKKCVSS